MLVISEQSCSFDIIRSEGIPNHKFIIDKADFYLIDDSIHEVIFEEVVLHQAIPNE